MKSSEMVIRYTSQWLNLVLWATSKSAQYHSYVIFPALKKLLHQSHRFCPYSQRGFGHLRSYLATGTIPKQIFGILRQWCVSLRLRDRVVTNTSYKVWEMLESTDHCLFDDVYDESGAYMAKKHLARMVAFLGSPPKKVVELHLARQNLQFESPVRFGSGKELSSSVKEIFGGPFFEDINGKCSLNRHCVSTTS